MDTNSSPSPSPREFSHSVANFSKFSTLRVLDIANYFSFSVDGRSNFFFLIARGTDGLVEVRYNNALSPSDVELTFLDDHNNTVLCRTQSEGRPRDTWQELRGPKLEFVVDQLAKTEDRLRLHFKFGRERVIIVPNVSLSQNAELQDPPLSNEPANSLGANSSRARWCLVDRRPPSNQRVGLSLRRCARPQDPPLSNERANPLGASDNENRRSIPVIRVSGLDVLRLTDMIRRLPTTRTPPGHRLSVDSRRPNPDRLIPGLEGLSIGPEAREPPQQAPSSDRQTEETPLTDELVDPVCIICESNTRSFGEIDEMMMTNEMMRAPLSHWMDGRYSPY